MTRLARCRAVPPIAAALLILVGGLPACAQARRPTTRPPAPAAAAPATATPHAAVAPAAAAAPPTAPAR
ncbi:MAG: hypothetical protein U9Q74_13190, partial [Gemmatimonadota bacterium]|nr:hypothetical protein [Gemmatimonadota bacterium]